MPTQMVVDTNVLMHADDERQAHQVDSQKLLQDLAAGKAKLCVDNGFNVNEALNKSLIGGEYYLRLTATHSAFAVIAHLFANDGIAFVPRKVPTTVKKCVEQCVRTKRDRTFLFVAHNSSDRLLCSHDFEDMSKKKRQHLRSKTDVRVVLVAEARALL